MGRNWGIQGGARNLGGASISRSAYSADTRADPRQIPRPRYDERELAASIFVGGFLALIGFFMFALVFFSFALFDFG